MKISHGLRHLCFVGEGHGLYLSPGKKRFNEHNYFEPEKQGLIRPVSVRSGCAVWDFRARNPHKYIAAVKEWQPEVKVVCREACSTISPQVVKSCKRSMGKQSVGIRDAKCDLPRGPVGTSIGDGKIESRGWTVETRVVPAIHIAKCGRIQEIDGIRTGIDKAAAILDAIVGGCEIPVGVGGVNLRATESIVGAGKICPLCAPRLFDQG